MKPRILSIALILRGILLLVVGILGVSAWSQTDCSIDLGPDITLEGEQVQLDGPAGFNNYVWSTGATSQNISVDSPR